MANALSSLANAVVHVGTTASKRTLADAVFAVASSLSQLASSTSAVADAVRDLGRDKAISP